MPPLVMGRDTPLHACFEQQPKYADGYKMATELRQLYDDDPDARRTIDVALGLEGLRRQDGIHAAAVVITRDPLTEYLPVQRKPEPGTPIEESPIVTQYEMNGVQELGLLKMDFLGLRNLDVMEIALDADRGVHREPGPTSTTSRSTTRRRSSCCDGPRPSACSSSKAGRMRALIRSLAPKRFEDVCALVALYRPGPMGTNMHNEYADRANGRKPVVYYHQDLEEILAPTYGLMIYQEQLMRVAQKLAGYSLEEADNLRKAAAKKKRDLMRAERSKFVGGLRAQRVRPRVRQRDVRRHRTVRRLLVPEGARDRLRPHRLPNRVAQGELPGPVPRRAAHERQDEPRPGRGVPQRVPAARHPGARPRRERVGERLLVRVRRRLPYRGRSLRAVGGAQRR